MTASTSTKQTHTPGPWHTANGVFGLSVCGPIQAGLNGGTTALCICQLPSPGMQANACLIAAAPELLQALKDARWSIYGQHLAAGGVKEEATNSSLKAEGELIERLDRVIAKAEGRD